MSNAHVINCPFCEATGLDGDETCWFCQGDGTAWADHGEHVGHDEGCSCGPCTEARADFTAWCDGFNARWAARKAERALTEPSGAIAVLED